MLLNVESKQIRLAHLRNGQLVDLTIERKKARQMSGNIYRGRVTNTLQNIQSAFIDINESENGFIHMSDIIENTKKFEQQFDMDFELDKDINTQVEDRSSKNIEEILKPDQPVLVQVVKEPIGTKGARLTSNLAIAGRYLVLLPNSPHRGISRKIEDKGIRDKLKKLILSFEMPHDMGLILRTASARVSKEKLIDEVRDLFTTWEKIKEKFQKSPGPALLYEESDLIKRALLTCVDKKFDRLLIDDYPTFQTTRALYKRYAEEHPLKIEYYRDKTPMFERFNVEKEIDKATRRKLWLPSGGYLFFDKTEAMYTIDVNSGRSTIIEGDVEEAILQINMEAAYEITRQLRLRNIGGIVICDFIDMRSKRNQRRLLERFKECMKEDPAKCTILGMSEFNLIEMTRQRQRESLMQLFFTECPYCVGRGVIKNHESVAIEMERNLKKAIQIHQQYGLKIVVHPHFFRYMESEGDAEFLIRLGKKMKAEVEFATDDTLHLNDVQFFSTTSLKQIDL